MADSGQKTEQPTDRRIEKAREEGDFSVSKEFVSSIQFTAFVMLAGAFSTELFLNGRRLIRFLLTRSFEMEVTIGEVVRTVRDVLFPAAAWMLAAGMLLVVVSMGAQLATTKMGLTLKKLTPDFSRLSPLKKLKSLPRQNVPQFFQALVLLPLFLTAVYVVVNENLAAFLRLPLLSVENGLSVVGGSIEALLWRAAALFLVIGCIDLVRTRRRYKKDLRMTKQEIRDEHKEVEGNPQIKGRIRRLQRELLRRQMMSEVEKATAVVVNPTHY
ncbi:MAG: EscU/YscU/HrcU family type III secretion system export apparatus switch protein, partial [bacterium]|nr:EscU/YscU/HrcU family type III secretion system export apparatus switch protein [bacterium]